MQIASSGRLPDQYNSKEKQIVRNRQWLPVYREIASNLSPPHIQYLCFPSPSCAFIKQLLSPTLGLLGPKSFVIALEKSPTATTEIIRRLSVLCERDSYDVINMSYEDAVESDKLIGYFMRRRRERVGFDILELDFTDSLFSMNTRGESRILDAVIRTLMLQSISGRKQKYYLITSFRMGLMLPKVLKDEFSDPVVVLCKNFIQRYDAVLSEKVIGLSKGVRVDWSILYSIPSIIIEHAPRLTFLQLKDVPYIYISRSVGAKARIASFVFTCEYRRPSLFQSLEPMSEAIRDAFEKVQHSVWVNS